MMRSRSCLSCVTSFVCGCAHTYRATLICLHPVYECDRVRQCELGGWCDDDVIMLCECSAAAVGCFVTLTLLCFSKLALFINNNRNYFCASINQYTMHSCSRMLRQCSAFPALHWYRHPSFRALPAVGRFLCPRCVTSGSCSPHLLPVILLSVQFLFTPASGL